MSREQTYSLGFFIFFCFCHCDSYLMEKAQLQTFKMFGVFLIRGILQHFVHICNRDATTVSKGNPILAGFPLTIWLSNLK